MNAEDFGKAVREVRELKGWSQEFLAAKVGATQSTIDRIESGATRRSRIMPEIAAALDIAMPGASRPSSMRDANKLVKIQFVLPPELLERMHRYKEAVGISSDDEAARRLIDDALKHRDDFESITDRLIEKFKVLKSLREAAGYVLANHPLVSKISFEGSGVSFELTDGFLVEVNGQGIATIYDANRNYYIFFGYDDPIWASTLNLAPSSRKPKYDLDDDIPT